ncbi:MAG: hypothetical protein A3I44_01920 [Candidatus Sungbacteria bacterium RIFCSPLOWO2_02_FULL_51_17]|uniref:tRNA N6-adenosine threonylcarbamoyltransferase n=1 Tax=Candidatus Sungbacteria bacterium RIFCSPHIGHO2_02_FULL_51_29 TaxID=1802273 RepID=A0A1G2KQU0_9BACT|nr:MAG: hypothetical protein A2676_04060 [Candidatus Sungbacteria bacterium RIFCSPHIGHO2_01_FULL_51_22]OHA01733.1 MAG: hypothetical protein A3C16_04535 [Candidatus Sungbacteria bacterium RIFCSPHIGHO2_02_FULL_51_29]OHA07847.1 MAG: hypothetical protein A3B29_00745 [Candidatus Sungbacteria bacterium RIFCSPLOWO2_01_FULL_51_34]OHA11419.1 MAG: hypothetical protein A3I44_01920 [Candidatus Sungbacteria bacterium RIFCSPLOWO2_02_FULL_51_17]
MRILAIETSCDETAVAIVETGGSGTSRFVRVLASKVSSQIAVHAPFGGVVPNIARREHEKNLVPVLCAALKEGGVYEVSSIRYQVLSKKANASLGTKYSKLNTLFQREPELLKKIVKHIASLRVPEIDAIAVTYGPGLAPALWVGVNFARALGVLWGKPVIPVNHLEGHIYTNFLPDEGGEISSSKFLISKQIKKSKTLHPTSYILNRISFPALCLIVSGGHTELVLMEKRGSYTILGETLDDAAGEAFDKVAKMLCLGYPGGPAISALAEMQIRSRSGPTDPTFRVTLPRPMMQSADYNFSFSGLKTAVLYFLQDHPEFLKSKGGRAAIAREFQRAVVDVLVSKTVRAAKEFRVRTVMIGGGVAANSHLRDRLCVVLRREIPNTNYLIPNTSLTGDNALMIALAALLGRRKKLRVGELLSARPNLRLDE